ncbi:MAG: hypothetical protein AAFV53_11020 [Myxococcota bacterium]
MLLLTASVAAACSLLTPTRVGRDLFTPLHDVGGAERRLPLGSLLTVADRTCPAELQPVRVLASNPAYRASANGIHTAAIGDEGCIVRTRVEPLGHRKLLVQPQATHYPPGTILSSPPKDCAVQDMRPVTSEMVAQVQAVQKTWAELFGGTVGVDVTEWGRVSLPLPTALTADQITQQQDAERLLTPKQAEKATTHLGPSQDGEPLYTHFTGSDAMGSDIWGQADAISSLLRLAAGWAAACRALDLVDASARNCTLQIGDLGWYNDKRPDPLGHRHHYRGRCVDLRLFRNDGSRYEAYWNRPDDRPDVTGGYSVSLTEAFVAHARAEAPVKILYFNDPNVAGATPQPGHDDHIHLCF